MPVFSREFWAMDEATSLSDPGLVDRHGRGSILTQVMLLCPWERHLIYVTFFYLLLSWLVALKVYSNCLIRN